MLRFTPGKTADADEIDDIITPPGKYERWLSRDTPTTGGSEHDGSFTEVVDYLRLFQLLMLKP